MPRPEKNFAGKAALPHGMSTVQLNLATCWRSR